MKLPWLYPSGLDALRKIPKAAILTSSMPRLAPPFVHQGNPMKRPSLILALLAAPLAATADNEAVGTPLTAPPEIAAVLARPVNPAPKAEASAQDQALFTAAKAGDSDVATNMATIRYCKQISIMISSLKC